MRLPGCKHTGQPKMTKSQWNRAVHSTGSAAPLRERKIIKKKGRGKEFVSKKE
jgi:hypothetical protein